MFAARNSNVLLRLGICTVLAGASLAPRAPAEALEEAMANRHPVLFLNFENSNPSSVANAAPQQPRWLGTPQGEFNLNQAGPRPEAYPDFSAHNLAARLHGVGSRIVFDDPGESSPLDFARGDSLTLEAWVNLERIGAGQYVYLLGKGRTQNPGTTAHNQNYALRLHGREGNAHLSFLFRNARNRPSSDPDSEKDWHRWTARTGFPADSGWHHVALAYTFGQGTSLKGYVDGEEVAGAWDMGGRTDDGPVVDDDALWIGSSMGGAAGSSFQGSIDNVAIYRSVLPSEELKGRYHFQMSAPVVELTDLPNDAIRVEILEGIPDRPSWTFLAPEAVEKYEANAFGFTTYPTKYNEKGLRTDRTNPFLLRASGRVSLPAGNHRLLLRSQGSARLWVDGRLLLTTPFPNLNADGHEEVPEAPVALAPELRYLQPGHAEVLADFMADGNPHVFILEAFAGGKGRRLELGELSVSVDSGRDMFRLLSPAVEVPLTDDGWTAYAEDQRARMEQRDVHRRGEVAAAEKDYWARRHEKAREHIAATTGPQPPHLDSELPIHNAIDQFIGQRLDAAGVQPAALLDDYAFLRRVTLDTVGVVPTPQEIEAFENDPSKDRRARAVDRLLQDLRWADHWVSYWQDVLAENPGILKPMLNNTGPFRWWIHESMLDNKPMDRFVTELVMMEGSVYYGGPAGFGMATQNDVPMAAKAQIIGQAFLGLQMACARCHDAPYHDFTQTDLFSLAALLNRGPQEIPASSSIPTNSNIIVGRLVTVSVKPGSKIEPAWPFPELVAEPCSEGFLRNPTDARERLAALITDPRNERFPQVVVNRLWKRLFGWGLVEPVDDWQGAKPSHPELLTWLGRELVSHDYDLKHVARLILNSRAYQRAAEPEGSRETGPDQRLFAAPARRRLNAEQLVDSLFVVSGKPMDAEAMNMDVDGRRPIKDFNNLGVPHHAWEFASLSNERDRPALAMPKAQAILDTLTTFGWRESRQNPLSVRDNAVNVLQPAALANGNMSYGRITRLSDDHEITQLALRDEPLPQLVENVFLRVLSRRPTTEEADLFRDYLESGYEARRVEPSPGQAFHQRRAARPVSWSNHLNPEATRIKQELERQARAGDPPTDRLQADWRRRLEDMLWSLVNSPEFVFLP